jgi:flagellar basal-body rod protein FlgB
MSMADLPLLAALKVKMKWHQGRQQVLAENIANADTPDYRARDLVAPDFKSLLNRATAVSAGSVSTAGVAPARTNSAHLGIGGLSGAASGPGATDVKKVDSWEKTPEGNAVVLEEQMLKVAENQMDYQLATTLYARGLGLLRTAIGRRGG